MSSFYPQTSAAGIREAGWKRPTVHRRLGRVVFALTVVCAALCAHIAIDFAGDYLLPRDAYDDVAHHSRESIFSVAVFLAFLALWRTLRAARADVAGSRGALRALLRSAISASWVSFCATVCAWTIPALIAMAALDSFAGARDIDGVADLLGGSLPLGFACILASALLFGTLVWNGVRALARFDRAILRLVAILAERARHEVAVAPGRLQFESFVRPTAIVCAHSFRLRGPPFRA